MGLATLRNIAVNAVMAGCKPEYLTVIVAALSAVLEKSYGLAHRQTTTHAGAPLLIVNGPIVIKRDSGSTTATACSVRAGALTRQSGGRFGS